MEKFEQHVKAVGLSEDVTFYFPTYGGWHRALRDLCRFCPDAPATPGTLQCPGGSGARGCQVPDKVTPTGSVSCRVL